MISLKNKQKKQSTITQERWKYKSILKSVLKAVKSRGDISKIGINDFRD